MAELTKPAPSATSGITVAVYASDRGPGDAERASIMSQAGGFLARRGVAIICPVENGDLCAPLINSAVGAGGTVKIVANEALKLPPALAKVDVERIEDLSGRRAYVAKNCAVLVGLPGSLASVTNLYETFVGSGSQVPVALLNRNRAYEIMRGIAVDIFHHTVPAWEKQLVISESMEDLWNRLSKVLAGR